jgi:hypothetical protein
MTAADDYRDCAALSARLAKILPPEPRERWLAMSARWHALATSAQGARTPHAPREHSLAEVDDTALDDIFEPVENSRFRVTSAETGRKVPEPSGQFLSTFSASAAARPQPYAAATAA